MAKPLQQDEDGNIINDSESKKTQKGYANYEKNEQENQRKLDSRDAKVTETVKSGVEKIRGVLGLSKGGSASSRADGCAIRGKTKA